MALIKNKTYYTYSDVTIVPGEISNIEHRSECVPLDENGMLPLFTAPMDTVVNKGNFKIFNENLIYSILPRTFTLKDRVEFSSSGRWAAYSLTEFEDAFCDPSEKIKSQSKIFALIDIANGHMEKLIKLIVASKKIYCDDIIIMVGNIANPLTFKLLSNAGADFIRCGIGNGKGCLTSSNLGIHVPMASLIDEIATIKKDFHLKAKIIADGGIRNYSDIIKAIGLGADYVMVGSVFAKMIESAAAKTCNGVDFLRRLPKGVEISDLENVHKHDNGWYGEYGNEKVFLGDINATFYGMASRQGQIALNGSKTKTSEGVMKTLSVDYTMEGWCNNFIDYLRSAMSYVGVKTLGEFRDKAILIINSPNAVTVVNK